MIFRYFGGLLVVLLALAMSRFAPAAPLWHQIDVVRFQENGVDGLDNVYDLVISADGKHLYTAAHSSSAVTVFDRDPVTGLLAQKQVLDDGEDGIPSLAGARAVRLSPDGNFVYCAGTGANAITIFERDTSTGLLTFLSTFTDGGALNGLNGINSMNLTGDGKFLYAASETNHSLSVFERNLATGQLSFVDTLLDGFGPTTTLNSIRSFTISDDDLFLYAPARDDDDLTVYSRDTVTGLLSQVQAIASGPGNQDYTGPTHIGLSPDGLHAYVASQFTDSLSLFDIDSLSGALTFKTTYFDGVGGFDSLDLAEDVIVSHDGQFVFVTATIDGALSIFVRDGVTGELSPHQEFRDGIGGIDGLFRAREMYLSPDGRHLYVAGTEEHAIAIFGVPEPSSVSLAGLGALLGAIAMWRRTRRR